MEDDFNYKRDLNMVNGFLFCKKYIPVANKLFFTIGGNLSSGVLFGESNNLNQKYKDSGFNAGASASIGFSYFVNKHLGLSTSLGSLNYRFSQTKSTYNSSSVQVENINRYSVLE